jgi:hypothetical protein
MKIDQNQIEALRVLEAKFNARLEDGCTVCGVSVGGWTKGDESVWVSIFEDSFKDLELRSVEIEVQTWCGLDSHLSALAVDLELEESGLELGEIVGDGDGDGYALKTYQCLLNS